MSRHDFFFGGVRVERKRRRKQFRREIGVKRKELEIKRE